MYLIRLWWPMALSMRSKRERTHHRIRAEAVVQAAALPAMVPQLQAIRAHVAPVPAEVEAERAPQVSRLRQKVSRVPLQPARRPRPAEAEGPRQALLEQEEAGAEEGEGPLIPLPLRPPRKLRRNSARRP